MSYLVGVLVMVVGVLVSIGLHELGHMVPAKRFGVRVSQYMVGFGPTLWSRTRGETEYGIKAIPLGGYVRLVGMYPPGDPRKERRAGRVAELVQSARDASAEEIHPGEEHRAFYNLSAPKKLVVMLGGPLVNLVIAVVLVSVVVVGFGTLGPTTTLGTVAQCVLPLDAPEGATCTDSDEAAPAAAAGLLPGDTIVEFDGERVGSWDELATLISLSGGRPTDVVVDRGGDAVESVVTPVVTDRPVLDGTGVVVVGPDGEPRTRQIGYLGIGPTQELQPQSITVVPGMIGERLEATAVAIATLPQRMADVAEAAFGDAERDETSIVGVVGVGRFAGEITSAEIDGYGTDLMAADLLMLLAGLNVALFGFNMIPLLPLDGGHVVGALYEGSRRSIARARGLPRPSPADTARMMPLAYGVFVVLAAMGALLIYADIVKPVRLM
ncbi:M50 family metallopeptidase [Sanguibacter suaedae]|uniref:Site-2 protease family protein n=1 Tax=Sanguibacter suaedae TaxID=2795737 RepID=A0A934MEB8_9MICO|nr:site-2 protease family protein [Sanguibacter suaedae]MBI9115544.1 site-2 protease family protein [Sanguibacter suaedae]